MTAWFDSHCHLESMQIPPEQVVRAAADAGVEGMVTVGTDVESSARCVAIASGIDGVWASVGVHPHSADTWSDTSLAAIDRLSGDPAVVAIGEIGLDYYRDLSPREDQRRAFVAQLDLAKRLDIAVIIHVRDALPELFEILEEAGPPGRLVFHCFSGGPAETETALSLGGYISFAGNISYPKSTSLREAAAVVPGDRLLVETDSPYLAPAPHRGKPNAPALVPLVGRAVAEARGAGAEEIALLTAANARTVFGL